MFHADPHPDYDLSTETGCTILFMQYPGPTTGAAPLYKGRMNLEKLEDEDEFDLNLLCWAANRAPCLIGEIRRWPSVFREWPGENRLAAYAGEMTWRNG